MNIALVDDCAQEREWLAKALQSYLQVRQLDYELFNYESGEAFVADFEKTTFDIVFMDIYMNGMTGIDAAMLLRRHSQACKLVFITTSLDFLREGYAFNPCHYLVKPVSDADFMQAMQNCQLQRGLAVPVLQAMCEGALVTIDTQKIQYIDFCYHKTLIHTTEAVLAVSGGFLQTIQPLLADERFMLCIKGVLVNMDYILQIEKTVFVLKNGERLQMTLRNKNSLIKQYHSYQFERASSREGSSL